MARGTGSYKFAVIKEAKARARRLKPEIPLIEEGSKFLLEYINNIVADGVKKGYLKEH